MRAPTGDGTTVTIAAKLTVADPFEADEVASRLERAIGTAPAAAAALGVPVAAAPRIAKRAPPEEPYHYEVAVPDLQAGTLYRIAVCARGTTHERQEGAAWVREFSFEGLVSSVELRMPKVALGPFPVSYTHLTLPTILLV